MNNKLLSSDLKQSFMFDYLCCHFWTFSFLMLMSDDAAEECSCCLYWGRYFLSSGHSLLFYGVFSHWIDMTHHTSPTMGREWLKMFLGRGMGWGERRSFSLYLWYIFEKHPDGLWQRWSSWWIVPVIIRYCPFLSLVTFFGLKSIFVWYEYGLTTFFWLSFAWTIHSLSFHFEPCVCF